VRRVIQNEILQRCVIAAKAGNPECRRVRTASAGMTLTFLRPPPFSAQVCVDQHAAALAASLVLRNGRPILGRSREPSAAFAAVVSIARSERSVALVKAEQAAE
jgi:hypothetical protein